MICLDELNHICHIYTGCSQICIYSVKVSMYQFDIIVKPNTSHNILINLDAIKYNRHQNIHLLLN